MEEQLKKFYKILDQEEKALRKMDIELLNQIRDEKGEFILLLERLFRRRDIIKDISDKLLYDIQRKNRKLNKLYQFSLSLFKPNSDPEYGPIKKKNYSARFNITV